MTEKNLEKKWTKHIDEKIVGRKIVRVEYLSNESTESFHWYNRPIVLILDDGSEIIPSMDDEGNDGGALFFLDKIGDWYTFPVLGVE